jgi:hypothetical protein
MSLRLSDRKLSALRALVAAGFIGSFLFTLVLGAIPELHERIHQTSSGANHECAVTLLASGSYEHTVSAAVSIVPPQPPTAFAHVASHFQLVTAHLEFSLLEHAPPSIS